MTTEIAPITGTTYNYALAIPLAYYDTSDTNYATGSARLGETIRFTVNGVPALLKDTDGDELPGLLHHAPRQRVCRHGGRERARQLPDRRCQRERQARLGGCAARAEVRRRPDAGRHDVAARSCNGVPAAVRRHRGRRVQLERRAAHPAVRGGSGELRAGERDRSRRGRRGSGGCACRST